MTAFIILAALVRWLMPAGKKDVHAWADLSDDALLRVYQESGRLEALKLLMQRHSEAIVSISMHHLGDDQAVQDFAGDLLLSLHQKLQSKEVGEIRNFRNWLMVVARNKLLDGHRKQKIRRAYAAGFEEQFADAEQEAHIRLDLEKLQEVIAELLPEEQRCIRLLYFDDKSYREIEAETNWDFNQIRGYRQRAIKKLRDRIGTEMMDYFRQ